VRQTALPLALRLALRELRGGLAGFYVFVACIALGVAALAGVNSVARALTETLATGGRSILGGDLAFSLIGREASPAEKAFLNRSGRVGDVATMRAIARRPDRGAQALVELKAVDGAYPHQGSLILEGGATEGQSRLAQANGVYGALAAPELLDRLGAKVGDRILLGTEELALTGVIRTEPDRLSGGVGFGPRLMISIDALRASGLVRPGSLVTWIYRLSLPDAANGKADIRRVRAEAARQFPEAGWAVRSRENASPSLAQNIQRFSQFLTLVGLTALVVGGVGIANAVANFVEMKRGSIATLKCLGASGGLIFRTYLVQVLVVAVLGILIGLALGALMPLAARTALADVVPLAIRPIYPREVAVAIAYGVLVTLSFALPALGRARATPAAHLFADRAILGSPRPPVIYRLAQLAALAVLAALAIIPAADRRLAVLYVASVGAAFVILRLVAAVIMLAASRIRTIRGMTLRLAVRNMHRPGALTPSVVLSLGLGLTLLVSLALIDTNFRGQLSGEIADRAPDIFLLDIQQSEHDALAKRLTELAPGGDLQTVPMMRGRFVAVKGVPTAQVRPGEDAAWALRGDRGVTYSDTLPPNSKLVAGNWWGPGYSGEPLVSLEADIAKGLGVAIGDSITVNVLGRNVTARVANLRKVDWESLSINFVLVYSPNTFRGAPHADLATLRLAPDGPRETERAVLSAVAREFPSVTAISVRDAIATVNALVGEIAMAVRVAASLALVVSMLVLGGALAAGNRQRRQDAVILKTLGATRKRLLAAFSLEYGLLGAATAIFAILAGSASAWYVVTRVMEMTFALRPEIAAGAAVTAVAVTLGLGLAGTWRILAVKPAPLLKNL
jgi:putative ABC transport system permease protein